MFKFIRLLGKSAVLTANVLMVLCLLLAYASTHISPETLPFLAFFGISYVILLVVNVLFVAFWLVVKKRFALLSGLAIVVGFSHFLSYFQPIPPSLRKAPEGKSVHVLSQNVRLFGWYNWRTNIDDRDRMFRRLEQIDADVMCFQEFFHNTGQDIFEVRETLKLATGADYLYDAYTSVVNQRQHYGIATLSKYPIVHSGRIDFEGERSNVCIYTDIAIMGDTLRVYNAHVASIRFSDKSYAFIEEVMQQPRDGNADLAEGLNIAARLHQAYQRRARQTRKLLGHMATSPYPVVFCGDLNDTPVSYTYGQLSRALTDSFRQSGWGVGNTYLGLFPSFRIDYIFHDPSLRSFHYTTHPEETSDHHAISTRIYF